MKNLCHECGSELVDEYQFCKDCGTQIPNEDSSQPSEIDKATDKKSDKTKKGNVKPKNAMTIANEMIFRPTFFFITIPLIY